MGISRTEGVILKTIPYGETSKIVTALTRDFGKMTFLARGARDTKSKFGGSLELFTHVGMIFYERENRDLQYLSDASIINGFDGIHRELDRTYTAMATLEMCNRVVHGNEDCESLFFLLVRTLSGLEESRRFTNGFLFFLMQLAEELGFRIESGHCDFCASVLDHESLRFDPEKGRLMCEMCPASVKTVAGLPISKESAAILGQLSRSKGLGVFNLVIGERAGKELYQILMKHLQYHMEELRQLNTLPFLKI